TTPSGWRRLYTLANSTAVRQSCYVRKYDGTEAGVVNIVTSGSNLAACAQVYRVSGWYGDINEILVFTTSVTSTAPAPINLARTWGAEDTLWIAAYGADDDDDASAYPSSFTDGVYTEASPSGALCSMGSARRNLKAASLNPGAFTIASTEEWVAAT